MRVQLSQFFGEMPRLYPTQLPQGAAQGAHDINFERGTLLPARVDTTAHTAGSAPVDFYLHKGSTWLTFPQKVDVVPGPVAGDRLYITYGGSTAPKLKDMGSGGQEYNLALPTPSAAPTTFLETDTGFPGALQIPYDNTLTHTELVTEVFNDMFGRDPDPAAMSHYVGLLDAEEAAPGTGLTDEQFFNDIQSHAGSGDTPPLVFDRTYVYTWVSIFDEESLPSPPSTILPVPEGSTVRLTFIDQPPSGSRINRLRVYCSDTTALGASELFFVKELNVGASAYVHDLKQDPLQELLAAAIYDPPVNGLEGMTEMQAGVMAAFKGKSLYFSEPYKPHAWPKTYELLSKDDIVSLVRFGNFLAVLTTGEPYIVQGTEPANMIMERIEQNTPCLSADGVVDMGYAAAFPSTDGLVIINQSGANIITRSMFTRQQWQDLNPSSFSAGMRDGAYVFTCNPVGGGTETGIIFVSQDTPSYATSSTVATDFKFDVYSGKLHYSDGSSAIKEFEAISAAFHDLTWQSGEFHFPTVTSFAAILVEGEALDNPSGFSAEVYRDGILHTTVTRLDEPARLKPGLGRRWSVKINGKVQISRITLAGDMSEIWG